MSDVLWTPSPDRVAASRLTAFAAQARDRYGVEVDGDYEALWRWSVEHLENFWALVWEHFEVGGGYDAVVDSRRMPGARWFTGARLNLAARVLARRGDGDALVAVSEDGTTTTLSWDELRGQVGALTATLRGLGVGQGDRVVAYLPNTPHAVVALLAVASLGAVWSTCGPDIGPRSAVDRFGQLSPKVLLTVDGYRFNGRDHDRREAVAELLTGLPTVEAVVHVPFAAPLPTDRQVVAWADAVADVCEPDVLELDAEAPLWVVYSSGTTGLPKGLVHSHVGVLLVGLVQHGLQYDVREGDRFFWYSSTSWIMWNVNLSSLLLGATAVLYDGSPLSPGPDRLWQLAGEQRLTVLGTNPGHLLACEKAGLSPGRDHDLSSLRGVGSTGSPLPASSFRWVYEHVGDDLAMHVISGGTDFAAALLCDAPWLPVTAGEMSCRGLGIALEAWDAEGRPLVDEVGELVLTAPLPSMPLRIWGDDDGSRYAGAYFDPPYEEWPELPSGGAVWRHGDWVTITSRGTGVVHGRSDSTLNRHGVRMGSADLYAAVEAMPEVVEALVLGVEQSDGGYWLPLFVVLADGVALDDDLVARIRQRVREQASPRHVPDEVVQVPAVPRTATGKKLEVPLKRMAQGVPVDQALNLGSVGDPSSVEWFVGYLAGRGAGEA
ncbi:MAG: acetoacetyl-CoA synthase [Frankiales bacterium]|nr:acetoacetyl-CoA synthase [Frankiales bacterium]